LFEKFFGSREPEQKVPTREELERRSKQFELRLTELANKRADTHHRMELLDAEYAEIEHRRMQEIENRRESSGSKPTLAFTYPDIISKRQSEIINEQLRLRLELGDIQKKTDKVFEEMQQDDEALKSVARNRTPS
jgi:hypothetical protein